MSFNERLDEVCYAQNSHVCVGLDLDIRKIPAYLLETERPLYTFAQNIIDATSEYVAAYKLNTAFYEALGVDGWKLMADIVKLIPRNIICIADAKRADIGNTSKMYARAFFREFTFDAITLNPYLGIDGIAPFIEDENKGAIILCLTSNRSAQDFQYTEDNGLFLYEKVAKKVEEWNTLNNCCLVVGATHPQELRKVRELAPDLPFLIPGIGAQGGDLELSVKHTFNLAHHSSIFNSSRGILYGSDSDDYHVVAGQRSRELRDEINKYKI